jgi:hypothetical protein
MGRQGESTDVIGRMNEWHVRRKCEALEKTKERKNLYETSHYDR